MKAVAFKGDILYCIIYIIIANLHLKGHTLKLVVLNSAVLKEKKEYYDV